jgi:predicted DNA-binding transcriptional regulator YafY
MSVTTKQIARYRIIDECLQNTMHMPSGSHNPDDRGIWSIRDLIEAVEDKSDFEITVSDRTIKEDIRRMREDPNLAYYAPIENKHGIGYYYSESDFKITETPLSPAEITVLNDVIGLLKQFKGFKYFEGAEGLIHNIEQRINHSEFLNVQFDVLEGYKGIEYIEPIKKAIKDKTVLKMTYKAFYEEAELSRHIHPYLLKEYNKRWFVYAYTNEYKGEGVYSLDRIIKLEKTTKKYKAPNTNKIIDYFKDIIGVTNYAENKVEEIILKVKRERANYIRTKPIHSSQKIVKESTDYVWYGFKLKPNNELNAWILSFGKDMIVEKPASLASDIKNILQTALNNYQE